MPEDLNMNIGVLISIKKDTDILKEFSKVRELSLQSCQVCIWDTSVYTDENAMIIKKAAKQNDIEISALWAGWSGAAIWDFYSGPLTLGLVPSAYRVERTKEMIAASDFAEKLGVTDIITHAGFMPENPNDPDYAGVISALKYLAKYMKAKGQYFLFETGQETPITLLRAIEDIGTGNIGINFDTANLILYGKSNAVDAAGIFGKYVRNLHCKDGVFPTNGRELGEEVPLGQGKADITKVLKILFNMGYSGPLTIEREISGEQQIKDIIAARDYLLGIVDELRS
jgi:L-ribulose-5-phosphate 3-epimerase